MASLLARTGRHRQRYEDNLRLVSGCIPYKLTRGNDEHSSDFQKLQVLMVSSPNRNDLVFPKGGWEDDESIEEAACREALEEAGVRGTLQKFQLGMWEFKSKSRQEIGSLDGGCRGFMFALEVTEELENWPEQENRSRRWVSIEEASILCRYDWMCKALEIFSTIMAEELKCEATKETVDEHPISVSPVVPERQIMSPTCRVKPPGTPHRGMDNISETPGHWHSLLKKWKLLSSH